MILEATPGAEALSIVNRLAEQMSGMSPALASLPSAFYQQFCATYDVAEALEATEHGLLNTAELPNKDYLLAVMRACAWAAHASRLPDASAWPAVVAAQRHAGHALAVLVAGLEAKERKTALAKEAKEAQTAINSKLRTYVLEAAAQSRVPGSLNSVVTNVVDSLEREYGSLDRAIGAFGASLKPNRDSLIKAFTQYVRHDMVLRNVLAEGVRVSSENFERWKETFR